MTAYADIWELLFDGIKERLTLEAGTSARSQHDLFAENYWARNNRELDRHDHCIWGLFTLGGSGARIHQA